MLQGFQDFADSVIWGFRFGSLLLVILAIVSDVVVGTDDIADVIAEAPTDPWPLGRWHYDDGIVQSR